MPHPTPLSLEGLAAILERHIEHTHQGFDRVGGQLGVLTDRVDRLTLRVDDLTGQIEGLVSLMREQGLRFTTLAEQQADQQVQIRQILQRLEQYDARFEEHSRRLEEHSRRMDEHSRRLDEHGVYIRRMLDLLERRGGDGGPASR